MLSNIFNNMRLANKLAIAIGLPLVGTLAFGGWLLYMAQNTSSDVVRLNDQMSLVARISDLVHELQKERGMSAVFLSSSGQKMASELSAQREETEKAKSAFELGVRELAAAGNAETGSNFDTEQSGLADLARHRTVVSGQSITAPDSNLYYTKTIRGLIDIGSVIAKKSADPRMTRNVWAYINLMHAKERAGTERALGTPAFGAGTFTGQQHERYLRNLGEQEAYLQSFDSFADVSERQLWNKAMENPEVERFMVLRKMAVETSPGTELAMKEGAEFFKAATARIELMRQVEEAVAKDFVSIASDLIAEADTQYDRVLLAVVVLSIASLVFGFWQARGISRSIVGMTGAMQRLADGDLSVQIPAIGQRDEVGQMGKAVEVFKKNMAATSSLADEFEGSVKGVVSIVSSAANELQTLAQALTTGAEQTHRQSSSVVLAAEQSSQRIQIVAAAGEELSASIQEISRQVHESSRITSTASQQAKAAISLVQELVDASLEINDVVNLISEIAAQTNLLALNATIEAARAGEAGKGFAVVASEVKGLANQTARATGEVSQKIAEIRRATSEASKAINAICQVIERMSEISASVTTAVTQQSVAAKDISGNVQDVARNAAEVTTNIASVNDGAAHTGSSAAQVLTAARELSVQSENLTAQVTSFVERVRAA
ncbi:MAG: methyl-accepting chemotaxis protein [Micropepsaceae bacterium]